MQSSASCVLFTLWCMLWAARRCMFCVMCGLWCVVWVIVDRRGAIGALVVLVAVRGGRRDHIHHVQYWRGISTYVLWVMCCEWYGVNDMLWMIWVLSCRRPVVGALCRVGGGERGWVMGRLRLGDYLLGLVIRADRWVFARRQETVERYSQETGKEFGARTSRFTTATHVTVITVYGPTW